MVCGIRIIILVDDYLLDTPSHPRPNFRVKKLKLTGTLTLSTDYSFEATASRLFGAHVNRHSSAKLLNAGYFKTFLVYRETVFNHVIPKHKIS